MEDPFARGFRQLLERPAGPLHLRLVLQPIVASFLAIRAGIRDARLDRPAFLWALIFKEGYRRVLLRNAWEDVGKVFIIAMVLDAGYQLIEFHWLYPIQAVIVAVMLALVPYIILRGPASRVARWRNQRPLVRRRTAG